MLGRQVSHFHIIRSLGGGGMGDVYEAQDTRLPRAVAIKFLKPAMSKNVEAVNRFKREARLAASVNHPNICTILEIDEGHGQAFIAMELLHGKSLRARFAGGALSLDEILDIGIQVADALGTAHDQGILHRDITPGNIFLTESGAVKLLDFGLAKHFPSIDADSNTTEEVTGPESITGTLHYMAPEQLARGSAVDHRCDLFSLGVVLYQMGAGARPFEASTAHELIAVIQEQPHVPMRQFGPQHPVEVERIIDKLLAKRPEDRYQSAWALRAELELIKRRGGFVPRRSAQDKSEVRRPSVPEAYHSFKRGQHYWKACFTGGWRQAIAHFQRAIDRDSQFAPAHVALAGAYNFLGFYCLMKPNLAFGVARESAERALQIDETLAAAHSELALTRFGGDWDWDGSEQEFRRALGLEPANALTHVYYSWLLSLLGREDAAVSEAQAGHALAPSSRLAAVGRAQTLYLSRRYDEAIDLCDASLRFDPSYVFATQLRGLCYLGKAMHREAVADLEQAATHSQRAPFYLGLLGLCYGECGMRDQAYSLIAELDAQARDTYVPPQAYVFILKGLSEREQALKHQERAYEDGASPFNYLTPSIRDLYALDPHHKKRLEQMRLNV